jgi:hypothetical protein
MRSMLRTLLFAAFGCLLSEMFAGCSGMAPAGAISAPQAPAGERRSTGLERVLLPVRLGAAPGSTLPSSGAAPQTALMPPLAAAPFRGLYVSDFGVKYGQGGALLLSPRAFQPVGKLTGGMDAPDGEWIDRSGNFYVANADGPNVTEYAPGSKHPTCTYSGANDPTNVKTDNDGNVFVVDWNDGQSGSVDVYRQCRDSIVRTYTFGSGAPSDVAFDGAGRMYVMYLSGPSGRGTLEMFHGNSMTPVALGATVRFPGGLLIDKNKNLIAADQGVQGRADGAIDVIAPPYSTASSLVTRLAQPVWLSLNRRETILFASSFDWNTPTVWAFDYPSGSLRETIGSANGLVVPLGVAASPDDVF